ncbi:MAG: DNA mismatch repair protein MutS [Rhodospirillales bacterium]|nr:DNA mismatch repair protein MutS [Rhodospirillales bacterium]
MMAQFLAMKRAHPEGLLFYRMGDFYELFFDDAVQAARALDIALTKRGKHLGADIPMCGVPAHSYEAYLARLIRKGFKVVICDQVEDPAEAKKRGAKSVVKRDVVRVVTAGTLTEDSLLEARRHNYLAAIAEAERELGLAWIDVSTGDFQTQPVKPGELGPALARLDPGEILIAEPVLARPALFETWADWKSRLTPLPGARFDSANGRRRVETLFNVATLDSFGAFTRAEMAAAGALVDYVDLTQKGRVPRLNTPRRIQPGSFMEIDAATRRNLELVEGANGGRDGSLLAVIDRTETAGGARLLAAHLATPVTDIAVIDRRLDMVQFFVDATDARVDLRQILRRTPDLERGLARLTLGRGGPRDLAALRDGLGLTADIRARLAAPPTLAPLSGVDAAVRGLGHHGPLVERLGRALAPELPLLVRDGGFIAPGYTPELDELRTLRDEGRRLVADLQARYAELTGVSVLKIRYNNVLGYYVEVPAKQASRIPTGGDGPFIHRQTMAGAVRYSSVELGDLESRILKATDRALALELQLFEDLVTDVRGQADHIAEAARALAALDVAAALAEIADERNYVRPVLIPEPIFEIEGGRHPVVEAALAAAGSGSFVANDCRMSEASRLWLITGPNMAGKSTFLRQNALIAVLAQAGSFVPAARAKLGVVDKLFSRVGAADDLARGRSTFMVEMVETAAILNQAGPGALVILDEIGRGTATFDGLSIAWAVVEHLHEVNRSRALFATHFHELTSLRHRLPALACHTMRVKEWRGKVVFLHEVGAGVADRSYGIHVGELAGLPKAVVERAQAVLASLETGEQSSALTNLADDLPLFAAHQPSKPAEPSAVETALRDSNPDQLSPKDALEFLYRLKALLDGAG